MKVGEINTPALLVDSNVFTENISHMSAARPGASLRPHVKAFKSSYLAKELVAAGHENFCCATIREMEGMAAAGLGKDLLLANQTLNSERLKKLIDGGSARVTVAVDSEETIQAAKMGGVSEVLIDVDVGMPRCGCHPNEAGELAEKARAVGLNVRGVMGYEGHLMHQKDQQKRDMGMARSIKKLETAHAEVGGEVISGGGTGTWELNNLVTELQAGSYVLMDTEYARQDLPFQQGLFLLTTVISVSGRGHAVLDGGLKALAMDSGPPSLVGKGEIMYCADEHTGITGDSWKVGNRVLLRPAHIDPTISKHEVMHLVEKVSETDDSPVIDTWPIDLRGW